MTNKKRKIYSPKRRRLSLSKRSKSPERIFQSLLSSNYNCSIDYDMVKNIYLNYLTLQNKYCENLNLSEQKSITDNVLKVVIQWLSEVRIIRISDLQIPIETLCTEELVYKSIDILYKTINILIRYINSTPNIAKNKIQLIGIVTMMIVYKNEIGSRAIDPKYCKYISDNVYTLPEIIEIENKILKTIDYSIIIPSPDFFYGVYKKFIDISEKEEQKIQFLFEYPNINFKYCHKPSIIALSSILVVKNIDYFNPSLESLINFLELDLDTISLVNDYKKILKTFLTRYHDNIIPDIENLYKSLTV